MIFCGTSGRCTVLPIHRQELPRNGHRAEAGIAVQGVGDGVASGVLRGADLGEEVGLAVVARVCCALNSLLPVGGEDLDKIVGDVLLTRAGTDEPAVFLLGEKEARAPHAGEIFYKDENGAICRRWNWKEADRTKLTPESPTRLRKFYVQRDEKNKAITV